MTLAEPDAERFKTFQCITASIVFISYSRRREKGYRLIDEESLDLLKKTPPPSGDGASTLSVICFNFPLLFHIHFDLDLLFFPQILPA